MPSASSRRQNPALRTGRVAIVTKTIQLYGDCSKPHSRGEVSDIGTEDVPVLLFTQLNAELLQKEASLPNPDPALDSATTAFLNERTPYMVPTYVRPVPVMVKGRGCYLWDMENRRFLDFTAGIAVNSLGHCDPEVTKVIAQQVCPL
jgi:aminotransferase class III